MDNMSLIRNASGGVDWILVGCAVVLVAIVLVQVAATHMAASAAPLTVIRATDSAVVFDTPCTSPVTIREGEGARIRNSWVAVEEAGATKADLLVDGTRIKVTMGAANDGLRLAD